MKCPFCNYEISENTKFCGKCGKKIPRCPSCGRAVLTRSRFCFYDGTPLPDDLVASLPEASPEEELPREFPYAAQMPSDGGPGQFQGAYPSDVGGEYDLFEAEDLPEEKKSGRTALIIIIIILAAVIAAAAVFAFLFFTGRLTGGNTEEAVISSEASEETDDTDYEIQESETETDAAFETETETQTEESYEDAISYESLEGDDAVQYFILNCDTIYFTEDDLDGWDEDMCRKARNGIYARHGRLFDDEELQAYFDSCSWYEGSIDPDDFDESVFNDCETANRDLIVTYEEEMGYR